MKNKNLLPTLFIIQLGLIFIGALLKIIHLPFGEVVLGTAIVVCLVFTIISLTEIYSSDKLSSSTKAKWLLAFLFVNTIAGLYYFSSARNNVIDNNLKA